jgi:uncharacterized phage protein (TIGR02220 family)
VTILARSRNIKPGFFVNDDLASLEPLCRLLFIGLWTIADREGRLEDKPKKIKAQVLPYDDCDVDQLLFDLAAAGFINRYQPENYCPCIQIIKFCKHQNPHHAEKASELPAPDKSRIKPVVDLGESDTYPADSLNPLTDSLNPINDSCNPESGQCETSAASNNSESKIPHKEIIDLLNECSGKDFKYSTKATQEHINARWREGFTIEDFEKVIRHKSTQWKDDPKMNPYLRPSTLFSPKFESYLNEKANSGNKTSNGGPSKVYR